MEPTDDKSMANGALPRDEARQLLTTTILRLQSSRCRLETQPDAEPGNDDAAVYIATAEMHLKAALFRLEAESSRSSPCSRR